ncbi:serine/threonine-protein kinase [Nonomuraea terrae]|uniref:serine/threonine-protein kinase n=1 Tax=Nonomuraea terrae TaxID=2530383 RepID=UPI0037A84F9E
MPWAAAIAAQVCSVPAAAHDRSLIHRDLRPGNLMLTPEGAVKVLDFGVAAAISPSATRLTRTGVSVGTPQYMAPEQALAGATGPRSDLYSLGVVLDEMITGENQFGGATRWRPCTTTCAGRRARCAGAAGGAGTARKPGPAAAGEGPGPAALLGGGGLRPAPGVLRPAPAGSLGTCRPTRIRSASTPTWSAA